MAKKMKYVYSFGGGKAEGRTDMKNLLGGKGANLAEMANLGLPVPPGFTITTDVCTYFMTHDAKYPPALKGEVEAAVKKMESVIGINYGDPKDPLLVSCRSGARQSMPGMMETVLNIGLTTKTIPGLIKKTGDERFVYDAYRRLITMYSDVVMEKAAGIEPEHDRGIRKQLEKLMNKKKKEVGAKSDVDLSAADLKDLCEQYKKKVKQALGKPFPDDAMDQLWGGIGAVFQSWNGKRAVDYRVIEGIPHEWGTATNVQCMVFGNMGDTSATGVAFTRNPATGVDEFYGEWLPNAQGEDVVAGIRTPNPLNEDTRPDGTHHLPSLETAMPSVYKQLVGIRNKLESHYHDMQDIEFTIQDGRLWMLQTRTGKRNGPAAVRMAVDMVKQKGWKIRKEEAIARVRPDQLDELLHPIIDPDAEKKVKPIAKGLPAGPGGASGQIVFSADDAVACAEKGRKVILVREETNPEDVTGMRAAEAILTARGGMTSHAALVARGWGKCCVVGAGDISVEGKSMIVAGKTYKEGTMITLNGTKGFVYEGKLPTISGANDKYFADFMKMCDQIRKLGVRTNADTPEDARKALEFGAEGIGLFRTEHMFYGEGSEKPLFALRKMILSSTEDERRKALKELYPHVKKDIKATLDAMNGKPVTVRLLDPPLHEFVPDSTEERQKLCKAIGISMKEFKARASVLHETNPMMGHRGVRLGVTYPEVSEMQVRAILEAAAELRKSKKTPLPEIMIPVLGEAKEFANQKEIIDRVAEEVRKKHKMKASQLPFLVGTMIEIPRACLKAAEIADMAEFFSFGTNDLTQMTFGYSRDDVGGFVAEYIEKGILPSDPFNILDQTGVGEMVQIGIERGRSARPKLKVGICGEHGGEPSSVEFCHRVGMNYVSCSPYRVPIARLAAAQAVVKEKM
ncbi:MAG: pyruvate, phosphate dikinase [Planctomycetes bacterium]|nr:pyruvate, phosphate dikinase [Planctomycetota bacterium]